ncbi:MAG: sodium/proline symporter PutP [Nitrospiraceae bacterium]|nr:sodium/proline symporter PutP [Nitrospiraceae bacterium]
MAAVFLFYLAGMLAIGVFFFRRTESVSDYFLGERSLNKWVAALSAQASDMSGWLLLGLPGAAYVSGLASAWIAIGLAVGTYLNWRLVATRLRIYTAVSEDTITLTDYLEYRFRATGGPLRIISAVFILVFFLIYTSSGFVAGGKLFSAVFGFPYTAALIVGAFVVVSYTFLGGFRAVCWTDFVQATLMFFAILIVPIMAVVLSGGPAAIIASVSAAAPHFFEIAYLKDGLGGIGLWIAIISSMAWGLGYFGQPHILVRFMAIRSPRDIAGARRIAIVWVLVSLAGAVLAGIAGRAYLGPGLAGGDAEKVFILMVQEMLPAVFAGVFLAAILAAIMSTADSQLLVTTSAITEDIYKALVRKNASENELVWVGRLSVVGVAVLAVFLALNPDSSVLELVAYAWAGFGAAFGPAILFSLFWRRMTHGGALAGLVTGGLTVLIWKQLEGGLFDVYEIVPGFLFSAAAIIIVSIAGPPPGAEILDEFTAVADEAARCGTGTA